jgi:CheY-like chemotaxis protein
MINTSDRSILLVEDDPLLRHAFRLLLEDAGYQVREAGTAEQALTSVASEAPTLVLLDLGLPDRPGLDVAREILGDPNTRHVRVVALTGRVGVRERQECFDAGCTHYFTKPIEPRELLRQLPDLMVPTATGD